MATIDEEFGKAPPSEDIDFGKADTDAQIERMVKKDVFDPESVSLPGAVALGAARGGSLDFVDEILAGGMALSGGVNGIKGRYKDLVKKYRDRMAAVGAAHPIASTVGQVGGALGSMFLPGLGALNAAKGIRGATAVGTGLGALQAIGSAENSISASDVGKGAVRGRLVS